MLGNLILVLIFSLYIVVDRDNMLDFSQRLVPERYIEEFRLLRVSVARSFGGFLRGQAILGLIYFFVALACQLVLGLQYTAASAVLSGALMAIPFFGPFVAWMPPVIVAALTAPDQVVPAILIMVIGMLLELNLVQPRVMSGTVGISPLVVLASVIIGIKIAGLAGAVFAVPIAAVLSSFFFFYLDRYRPKPTGVAVTDAAPAVDADPARAPIQRLRSPARRSAERGPAAVRRDPALSGPTTGGRAALRPPLAEIARRSRGPRSGPARRSRRHRDGRRSRTGRGRRPATDSARGRAAAATGRTNRGSARRAAGGRR